MNFWQEIYDAAKDRRYGVLFFGTFIGFLILFLVILACYAIAGANNIQDSVYPMLVIFGVFILATSWRLIRRARKRRREWVKYPGLSRDEIAKARSKVRSCPLMKKLPDIDLKY